MSWVLLVLLGMGACANDEPPFESAVLFDEGALPATLAEQQCAAQMDCECLVVAGPVGEDPVEHTKARCEENRRLEIEFWQKGAQHYGLIYDPVCLARRIEAMKEIACDDQYVWSALLVDSTCADRCRVYHGHLAEGAECDLEEDVDHCGQGLFCDWRWDEELSKSVGTCEKLCAPDGASCLTAGCAPGSQCRDAVCEPMPTVGDPCPEYWCLGGYCNPDSFQCEPLSSPGDACSSNTVTCGWGCVDGVCQEGSPYVCNWDFRDAYHQYY